MTKRLLITSARTTFAMHLTRLFGAAGHEVHLADSARFPLARYSRYAQALHRLPSPRAGRGRYAEAVLALIETIKPDLIIPTYEEAIYLAEVLEPRGMMHLLFAPNAPTLIAAHDKWHFSQAVSVLGYGAAQNVLLTSKDDVRAFEGDPRDYVFKPVWSRFAAKVLVGPERAELEDIAPTQSAPWIVQSRARGEEFSVYAVAVNGLVVALSPYRSLLRAGKGTGICFEPVDAPEITEFVARYVASTGWTGQISFDLMRETPGGRLIAIEANPRATSGVMFFSKEDNLPEAILNGKATQVGCKRRLAIKGVTLIYSTLSLVGLAPKARWFHYFFRSGDALWFPGDGMKLFGQAMGFCEMALLAIRHRLSVQEATTLDTDWDGAPPNEPVKTGPSLSQQTSVNLAL